MSDQIELKPDPGAPQVPSPSSEAATQGNPARHIPRRILTWFLVVLFALLTPIALTSAWAVKTLTNTERYVNTMQPHAKDPVIQAYVATKATNTLFDELNVQKKIANTLPSGGKFIAAPLTAQLKTFTDKQMLKLVSSTWFSNLWARENRFTQSEALAILTGKPAPTVTKARQLAIDLTPTVIKAIDTLDSKGVTIFNPLKKRLETNQSLTLQLASNQQLKQAQTFFSIAINARVALLIITPLIGLAAIAVSVRRRRTAFRVAIAGAIGCLILSIGLTIAKQFFINAAPTGAHLVANRIITILLRYLNSSVHVALAIFVIAAAVLWVIGDTEWAIALRSAIAGGSKQVGSAIDQARKSETVAKVIAWFQRSGRYVGSKPVPFRWIGIVVAAILVLRDRTIAGVLWTLFLLAIYQLAIFLLERWANRSGKPSLESGPSDDTPAVSSTSETAS